MYYYEVAPAYPKYYGFGLLTYQSQIALNCGVIVVVKIRSTTVSAIVIRKVPPPDFSTQPIQEITSYNLPDHSIGLFEWLASYYPSPIGCLARLFLPSSLKGETRPQDEAPKGLIDLPALTLEQQNTLDTIMTATGRTFLLHGDTATGKTRLYVEVAKKILASQRSVLILTPEISLTPQLIEAFSQSLAHKVYVTHSNLTPSQKSNLWLTIIASKKPVVVVGPRSALFMPIPRLGLIIVDEFHEPAYKQEQAPRYQATRVASKLAELCNARLIFGSATPSINDYYFAEQKKVPILRMNMRPLDTQNKSSSKIHIINLANQEERTSYPLLSTTLITAIEKTLIAGEQSLVFLNRRGNARVILCQICAWQSICPRCDLPYVYHSDSHTVRCHTCGRKEAAPTSCQSCGSAEIIFKSPGTKNIVENLSRAFPEATIARFDKDNLKEETLQARYKDLYSGEIDIVVGTQIVAKGLDLPKLSCVGVLLAESELNFPDYSAEERSYQLMKQLIGRVGRGHRGGQVIIQTYGKNSLVLEAATGKTDWDTFYSAQLKTRQQYGFPPFAHFLKLEVSRATSKSAQQSAEKLVKFLVSQDKPFEILGPHPSFVEKRGGKHVWQIILSSKHRHYLVELIPHLPLKCTYDLDPLNLL